VYLTLQIELDNLCFCFGKKIEKSSVETLNLPTFEFLIIFKMLVFRLLDREY